jgi:dihydrolipoamide dehydrogenase
MTSGLMPGVDRDLVRVLQKRSEGIYKAIMLETKLIGVKEIGNGVLVELERGGKEKLELVFDRVLVSVGRKPNREGLGLENTKVEMEGGDRIFAIGDVAGSPCSHRRPTRKVVVNLEQESSLCQRVPLYLQTRSRGATHGNRGKKIAVSVARFPWGASGRAATLGRQDGVTKIIADPETGRVLGVGIAGQGAGELIAEGVLAVEMAALASDIALSIHPHPTLSETLMEAAEAIEGSSTHIYRPGKK